MSTRSSSACSAAPDAHRALRDATAGAHARVDALFAGFDLGSAAGYAAFLRAHARAFLPVEEALDSAGVARLIPDWPARGRSGALLADLAELGMPPLPAPPFPLAGDWALLGAAYVLEGSRLGGAVLRRQVAPGLPVRYLGKAAAPGAWRNLLALLAATLYDRVRMDAAIAAAARVFDRFEEAARDELELGRQ